jgi:ubiquitin carboxyl-terminal hydrolase 14
MYSLCTPDLQKKLEPARAYLHKIDEEAAARKKKQKTEKSEESKTEDVEMKKPQVDIMKELNIDPTLINDIGCNVSGQYELIAVLTHVGRSTDSGHYIAWTRKENSNEWCMF